MLVAAYWAPRWQLDMPTYKQLIQLLVGTNLNPLVSINLFLVKSVRLQQSANVCFSFASCGHSGMEAGTWSET